MLYNEWTKFRDEFLEDLEKSIKKRFKNFWVIKDYSIEMAYKESIDYVTPCRIRIRPNQRRIYLNIYYHGVVSKEELRFEYNDPNLMQNILDGIARAIRLSIKPQYDKLSKAIKDMEHLINL